MHVKYVENKSLRQLGFNKFFCGNFNNVNVLGTSNLYFLCQSSDLLLIIVLSFLDLRSFLNQKALEADLNAFLGFLCYRCNIIRTSIPHTSYALILDILLRAQFRNFRARVKFSNGAPKLIII